MWLLVSEGKNRPLTQQKLSKLKRERKVHVPQKGAEVANLIMTKGAPK